MWCGDRELGVVSVLAFILPRWKWLLGGLATVIALVMILSLKAEVRHLGKELDASRAQTATANAKLAVSNASINELQRALEDKNAESERRAAALTASRDESARDTERFNSLQKADAGRIDTLRAIAAAASKNPGCRVPAALSGALEGL